MQQIGAYSRARPIMMLYVSLKITMDCLSNWTMQRSRGQTATDFVKTANVFYHWRWLRIVKNGVYLPVNLLRPKLIYVELLWNFRRRCFHIIRLDGMNLEKQSYHPTIKSWQVKAKDGVQQHILPKWKMQSSTYWSMMIMKILVSIYFGWLSNKTASQISK